MGTATRNKSNKNLEKMKTSAYICTVHRQELDIKTNSNSAFFMRSCDLYRPLAVPRRHFTFVVMCVLWREFGEADGLSYTHKFHPTCQRTMKFAGARSTVTHKQRSSAKRAENTVLTSPRSSSKRKPKTRPTTTYCRVACSKILGRILKMWNSVSLMHIRESLSVSLLSDFHSFMSNRRRGVSLPALTRICHG